ncbi:MAG: HAMP domain-containing histidine kinase [Candidatus Marinimicrobia bacterium]|nr:HAMP domain-containing histidine kinase [Candidatus Neomarinimicrobiota bacterium]MBT3630988.1 HAMP domain-containing histidine kinase [Candidatus Neomarinimicrobiota bacterium]MBT3824165.1 HAMP domain-containing histidine kinase [Candidatus Neomarinimicrobiota bacterium]MBT4130363.1 HAMP domain-containing histidine kinase [Candidatus Neomarinimicrobiota bacterium]MBT4295632.1 HAMP domain-containing histidine kinase [Candidatus Neomarinimicrobiota bacterium]
MTLFPDTPAFSIGSMLRRDRWLIRLRWYAILGLFIGVILLKTIQLGPPSSLNAMAIVGFILLGLNLMYLAYASAKKQFAMSNLVILLNLQMVMDLFLLTILIYLTGSEESPLSFFYVFHIILASIIFPGGFSYLYSLLVIILYSGLLLLEHSVYVEHICFIHELHLIGDSRVVIGIWFVFVVTMMVSAYLAQNVTERHRRVRTKLEITNQKLQEINETKTTFFRYASHEMKAPISTIQSTLMVIEDILGTNADERIINMLNRAIGRTSETIGMLKDLADLTYGNFQEEQQFDHLSLRELLESIVSDAKPNSDRKSQSLKFNSAAAPFNFFGDADALRKIFTNLISNAIRYTHESGNIQVSLEKIDLNYVVKVTDDGQGIPASEQTNIFKEFYRTPTARKLISEGTGLGLAIVMRMVELHGGDIQVDSLEGQGSTFTVQLPFEEEL